MAKKNSRSAEATSLGDPPVLTSLEPATATIGWPSFTLRVLGSNFQPDAVIVFNGYDEPTTLVSESEVTTGINMDVWGGPSEPLPVVVRNSDGLTSDPPLMFTFTAPDTSGDPENEIVIFPSTVIQMPPPHPFRLVHDDSEVYEHRGEDASGRWVYVLVDE